MTKNELIKALAKVPDDGIVLVQHIGNNQPVRVETFQNWKCPIPSCGRLHPTNEWCGCGVPDKGTLIKVSVTYVSGGA